MILRQGIVFLFIYFLMQTVYAATPSPQGYWKTIDDVTGKPKSILKIDLDKHHALYGQVMKIFPRPGFDQNEVCSACKGAKHNQRIVGMVVMQGLKQDAETPSLWKKGEILDPLNGKTYHCQLQISPNGQEVTVRGYIGVPLFGRSQTWYRVNGTQG